MNWSKIQTQLQNWCQQQPQLLAIYLFGSQAEGRANSGSDLDLALLAHLNLPHPSLWRYEDRWAGQLAQLLATHCTTDVFVLNLAPLDVRFQVITTGRMLWTSNVAALTDFESYTRRRYWDFVPYRQVYQQNLEMKIKERWHATQHTQYGAALEQTRTVHRRVKASAKAKP